MNRLLAALPGEEYDRLASRLEVVHLGALEIIAHAGEELAHAHFPLTGVISVLALDAHGGAVEVGTIGPEGMAGLPAFLGQSAAPFQVMGQIPGAHARLPLGTFLDAAAPGTALHTLLLRYARAYYTLTAQAAACNRLHAMEERLARWLLMTRDRVGGDRLPLTQEILGQMLGVRRPSVTLAAGILQTAGLIAYHRGTITILDHAGLEAAACECYAVIRDAFAALGTPA